uniref:Bacterial transcriptional activator domain-containing protein n=1 Tax=candidate division WOR-3 bacterium TaxID=2052148 RepID=A0A7V0Z4X8_UNCW3
MKLPVFNSEYAAIKIEFLGRPRIFRNKIQLKETIEPQKQSLLSYLALHIPEPHRNISLDKIYENFWPKSKSASRNLTFMLVMIRNLLKFPAHFLEIHHRGSLPLLTNNGIYFTTDYQEFQQILARAKALQRAGEWEFAKKEFLQAFKLFRGEPFKKNFDEWSVNMRFKILTELETEAIDFARAYLEHNDKHNSKKVLEKVLKIIPDSEEIKGLLKSLFLSGFGSLK